MYPQFNFLNYYFWCPLAPSTFNVEMQFAWQRNLIIFYPFLHSYMQLILSRHEIQRRLKSSSNKSLAVKISVMALWQKKKKGKKR